jgi:DNA-binding transcriptional MerR regulator
MKIGELAERTGVSVRMLRYYEQEGLLQPQRRNSGYRDFGEAEERTVRRIRTLSEAGLKLASIRQLLPCVHGDTPILELCPAVLATLRREIAALDEKIECLQISRQILGSYLETLPAAEPAKVCLINAPARPAPRPAPHGER